MQIALWSSDFKNLISDEKGRTLFSMFLQGEYSEENLDFWIQVENFRKVESDLKDKANDIYLTFQYPCDISTICVINV